VPLPLEVQQVSRTDVKLLTDRPLRFGTRIRLGLYINLLSAASSNIAVVHWCRPGVSGWQIGTFLTSPLPETLLANAWWELRNQIRYESNWRAWIRWKDNPTAEPVQVTNYSISGLRMQYTGQAVNSRRFWMYPNSSDDTPALLEGRVQWCQQGHEGHALGCYVFNEQGRALPRTFNQSSVLHVEVPDRTNVAPMDSLLPGMIENSDDNRLC
jgi:hypothetical protein